MNLKRLRHEKNITQAELAEKAGMSVVALATFEGQKKWPRPESVEALAKALGVGAAELFVDKEKERERVEPNANLVAALADFQKENESLRNQLQVLSKTETKKFSDKIAVAKRDEIDSDTLTILKAIESNPSLKYYFTMVSSGLTDEIKLKKDFLEVFGYPLEMEKKNKEKKKG